MKILSKTKFVLLQIFAAILYVDIYLNFLGLPQSINSGEYCLGIWNFIVQVAIMIALSMLLAPKPKQPKGMKPIGLEQFDIPTAEEGRPIQVLFGKKYIAAPNVVWYGHLKSQAVMG